MHSHIYGTVIFRKKPYLSLLFFKSQGKPTVSATNFSIFLSFLKKKKKIKGPLNSYLTQLHTKD